MPLCLCLVPLQQMLLHAYVARYHVRCSTFSYAQNVLQRLDGQAHLTVARKRHHDGRDVVSDGGQGRCGCAGAKRVVRREGEHRGATGAHGRPIVSALWVSQVRHNHVVGLDSAASQDQGKGRSYEGGEGDPHVGQRGWRPSRRQFYHKLAAAKPPPSRRRRCSTRPPSPARRRTSTPP